MTILTLLLTLTLGAQILACEVSTENLLIGSKKQANGEWVVLRVNEQLPDSPQVVAKLRVVAIPSGKVEETIVIDKKRPLRAAMRSLKRKQFEFPSDRAWQVAQKDPELGYQLGSLGSLQEELKPDPSDEAWLERALLLNSNGKIERLTGFQKTSASATETSRIEKIYLNPEKDTALVIFGNCSDELFALHK